MKWLVALVAVTLFAGCGGAEKKVESIIVPKLPTKPWKDRDFTQNAGVEWELGVVDANIVPRTDDLKRRIRGRDQAAVRCMAKHGAKIELDYSGKSEPESIALGGVVPRAMTNVAMAERFGFGTVASWQMNGTQHSDYTAALAAASAESNHGGPRAFSLGSGDPSQLAMGILPGVSVKFPEGKPPFSAEFDRAMVLLGYDLRDPDDMPVEKRAQSFGPSTTLPPGMRQNCTEQANDETGLGPNQSPLRHYALNAEKLRKMTATAIGNDRKISAATREYKKCMAAQGYEGIADPTAARKSISDAFSPIFQAGMDAVTKGKQPDGALVGQDMAEQGKALAVREIALATANLDCETAFRKVAEPRSFEVQKRVLRENQALVNSLRNPK